MVWGSAKWQIGQQTKRKLAPAHACTRTSGLLNVQCRQVAGCGCGGAAPTADGEPPRELIAVSTQYSSCCEAFHVLVADLLRCCRRRWGDPKGLAAVVRLLLEAGSGEAMEIERFEALRKNTRSKEVLPAAAGLCRARPPSPTRPTVSRVHLSAVNTFSRSNRGDGSKTEWLPNGAGVAAAQRLVSLKGTPRRWVRMAAGCCGAAAAPEAARRPRCERRS